MKLDEVKGGIKVFNGDDKDYNNSAGNDDEKDAIISTNWSSGAIVTKSVRTKNYSSHWRG